MADLRSVRDICCGNRLSTTDGHGSNLVVALCCGKVPREAQAGRLRGLWRDSSANYANLGVFD